MSTSRRGCPVGALAPDRRNRRRWVQVLFGIAFAFVLVPAASGANPCATDAGSADVIAQTSEGDSGLGGTGLESSEDDGIGGTGYRDAASEGEVQVADAGSGIGGTGLEPSGDDGIGGTGHGDDDEESGIGGTGIFGTITGFGSICVNGFRVHYDDDVPVSLDGEVASAEALAIGQVVYVHAMGQGTELQASAVSIHSSLVGPIAELDTGGARMRVMDQWVLVSETPEGVGPVYAVGERVRVGGYRLRDETVIATWIAPVHPDTPDAVSGVPSIDADGRFAVAGLAVEVEGGSTEAGDRLVAARGHWNAERSLLEAAHVREIGPGAGPRPGRLSIEGYVERRSDQEGMWLSGIRVDARDLDVDVARGQRVRVAGSLDRSGLLRAERIRVIDRPMELDHRADRPPPRPVPGAPLKVDRPPRPDSVHPTDRPPRTSLERPERPLRDDIPTPVDRPPRIDRDAVEKPRLRLRVR